MDEDSSENITNNYSSQSDPKSDHIQLGDIFSVFENANSIQDKELNNYVMEFISLENYYIFIYFFTKFKSEKYLSMLKIYISDKLKVENFDLNQLTEQIFEEKYMSFIELNSLSQAIDLEFGKFIKYFLKKEKRVPNPIIPRLLEKEWVDIIKLMLDLKVHVHEIESVNAFTIGKTYFIDLYYQPLHMVDDNMKVTKKSVLLPKHVVYYLYKSCTIKKEKREKLIKELASSFDFDSEQILLVILKMKDQDLAEELINNENLLISSQNIVISLICALKFNCARIAYKIFDLIKRDIEHLQNEMLHRALIRAIIDYPENLEIFIFIVKSVIPYTNTSNLKYLLSTLEQLLYFKGMEDCKFLRIVNALKTCVLILELISEVRSLDHQLITFCDNVKNQYMSLAKTIIIETKDKNSLINLFRDKDLLNRETISIISNNQYIELLNNPASEELVNKLWVGQVSTQGRFYLTSVQYDIIVNAENCHKLMSSIKKITDRDPQELKSFFESFYIWKNSILVKFYSKTFIFISTVLLFQLFYNSIFSSLQKIFLNMTVLRDYFQFKDLFESIENKTFTINQIINISNSRNVSNYYYQFISTLNSSNSSNLNVTKLSRDQIARIPDLVLNLTNILIVYNNTKSEPIEEIKTYTKTISYISYIFLYPFVDIIFKKLYIAKTGIQLPLFTSQYIMDIIVFVLLLLRIFVADEKIIGCFDKLDSFDDFNENDYLIYVYLVASILIILWVKVIEYLKFSEKLGPLIRIVEQIVIKVFYFSVILTIEVFVFGVLSNLLFALDHSNFDYRGVQTSILLMFAATLNQFEYKFDEDDYISGPIFLSIHLFISYVILLNMLIAVLSKIYEGLFESSKLLFQQEIITRKDEYIVDTHYGGMLNLPFPMNILNIIFCPFYILIRNKTELKRFNNAVNFIAYFPLLVGMSILQIASQFIFMPLTILRIFKLMISEIVNTNIYTYNRLTQKKDFYNTSTRIKYALYCLSLIITSPFWILFTVFSDYIFYITCLSKDNSQVITLSENSDDICVTPLIMNKIGEVFDSKPKYADLLVNDVISEFVQQLSLYNKNLDFKNFLIWSTKHPKENLSFIREYSNFVKFANKLKLLNSYQEQVIIKSLLIKLTESNSNFVHIKKNSNKTSTLFNQEYFIQNDSNNKSKSNQLNLEMKSDLYISSLFNEKESNSFKYQNMKMALTKFTSLPKLFYKRISMINLQDTYNAMMIVKSSDDIVRSSLKLRKDLKNIRKNIGEIVEVLNAKEVLQTQKRSINVSIYNQRKTLISRNIKKNSLLNSFSNENKDDENSERKKNSSRAKNHIKPKFNINNIQHIPEEKDD